MTMMFASLLTFMAAAAVGVGAGLRRRRRARAVARAMPRTEPLRCPVCGARHGGGDDRR
jgi:hypothetical protein